MAQRATAMSRLTASPPSPCHAKGQRATSARHSRPRRGRPAGRGSAVAGPPPPSSSIGRACPERPISVDVDDLDEFLDRHRPSLLCCLVHALEPSTGIGRFLSAFTQVPGLNWHAVEWSDLSSKMLKAMFPEHDVFAGPFDRRVCECGHAAAGRIGLVVSNPLYGTRGATIASLRPNATGGPVSAGAGGAEGHTSACTSLCRTTPAPQCPVPREVTAGAAVRPTIGSQGAGLPARHGSRSPRALGRVRGPQGGVAACP